MERDTFLQVDAADSTIATIPIVPVSYRSPRDRPIYKLSMRLIGTYQQINKVITSLFKLKPICVFPYLDLY